MFRRIRYTFALLLCLTALACLLPAAYADGLSDLQAAIENGAESYTLGADTLIPEDENIDAGDTELIVPADTALTVKGFLRVQNLEIRQGGSVCVDGGHLDCPWGLTPNGTLSIENDWVDTSLFSKDEIYAAVQAGRVSYSGDAGITLHWFVTDPQRLPEALNMAAEAMSAHDHAHIRASVEADGEMQIDTNYASLSVADGVTFQLNGVQPDYGRRELSVGNLNILSGGRAVIEDNALLEVKGRLTLGGQLTIGEHSELFITDQDEALVYSPNINRQGDFSHIVVHYYPDDESQLYPMLEDAEELPGYAHGNMHVEFNWTPDTDIVSEKTDFHFHSAVTIPAAKSLSLDNLYIDSRLTVEGALSVGWLHAWGGSELVFAPDSDVTVSESFELHGSLWTDKDVDISDFRLDPEELTPISYNGGILYVNTDDAAEIKEAFLAACAQSYSEPDTFFIPYGSMITLMSESVTIPENLTVFAIGSGFRLFDTSFNINGELICSHFVIGSGTLSVNGFHYVEQDFQIGGGTVYLNGELSIEHDAFDPATLVWQQNYFPGENSLLDVSFNMPNEEAVLDELSAPVQPFGNFRRSIWVLFPWELEADLTLPAQVRLCVPYGKGYEGSLLIPADKSLTIPAGSELYARGAGPETQQAVVEVRGEIMNNGSIVLDWGDTLGDIALAGSGSISGSGSIIRDGRPYDPVEEHAAYAALTAACAVSYNEPTEYDIEGTHVFTIRDNLTIPANLSVFAIDSTFEVASTGYFTIAGGGELIAGGLESFGSTAVNGFLHLERDCRILENPVVLNGELVMTIDAWVNLMEFINAPDPDAVAARFSFGDDSLLDIWVEPTEESISDSLDYPMFHIPHIRETYCVTFPWTLDHDRVLQQDTRLLFHYGGEATGMLIIPEGKTFTIPEGSELFARGAGENGEAIVRIAGLLINDGVFTLQYTRAGWADAELIDGGVYTGRGTVTRGGEPYAIWNDPANADIRFPAGLKTLESQALANTGVYFSVYIPAGTESIAADTFGDKTELIVFGAPGSEAETFAGNNNYLFAPVAPAA